MTSIDKLHLGAHTKGNKCAAFIVQKADSLEALIIETFLEYAQAHGLHIDTTRVRTGPRGQWR